MIRFFFKKERFKYVDNRNIELQLPWNVYFLKEYDIDMLLQKTSLSVLLLHFFNPLITKQLDNIIYIYFFPEKAIVDLIGYTRMYVGYNEAKRAKNSFKSEW